MTAAQEDAGGAGAEQLLLLLLLQLEALVAVARELPLCEGVGGGGEHHVVRAADEVRWSCPLHCKQLSIFKQLNRNKVEVNKFIAWASRIEWGSDMLAL